MYLVRMERPFKGVYYFIMSKRSRTVKEMGKRNECGGYSYSVHSTWVASKPPQGKAFHKPGEMEAGVVG